MNKVRYIAALFLFVTSTALATPFCEGFDRGYKAGYMKANGSSIPPLPPLCPLQPLKNFGDPDSDFEHGYIIGLQKGMADGLR